MRKIKQLKKWGIYALSAKEESEFGFKIAVIHPDVIGTGLITPQDSDMEFDSAEEAENWILNY